MPSAFTVHVSPDTGPPLNRRPSILRIGLTTALDGLRSYAGTAFLLGLALGSTLLAVLPLADLFGRQGDWSAFWPTAHPIPGGTLDLPWMLGVATPSAARQEAVAGLGSLLFLALWMTLVVSAVTILSTGTARSLQRRADRVLRRAVGASRRMLAAAVAFEAGGIGIVALLGGTTAAWLGLDAVAGPWPGPVVPGTGTAGLIAASMLYVCFSAVLLVPVFLLSRTVGQAETHEPVPTWPVVVQIGASFIVLSTGALLTERASALLPQASGSPAEGSIVAVSVEANAAGERSIQYQRWLGSLAARGLDSISLTSPGTLSGLGHVAMVVTDCGRCTEGGMSLPFRLKPANHKVVSADTFRLMGLPVLAGRGITSEDDWDAPRVAVVSRSLAAREFQDGQPIGRRIHTGDDDAAGSTVVGIVDDHVPTGLGGTVQPRYSVFVSALQHPPKQADLLVRDRVEAETVDRALRATLPPGSSYALRSERSVREAEVAPVRWFGRQFQSQGWAMVGVAALGILGYMALWVRSLEGEIGIRRSVGASRRRILAWLLGRGMAVALKGIAAGIWFGLAVWRTLPTVVTGSPRWDLPASLPYALALTLIVLCGVLPPAWRASGAPLNRLL